MAAAIIGVTILPGGTLLANLTLGLAGVFVVVRPRSHGGDATAPQRRRV